MCYTLRQTDVLSIAKLALQAAVLKNNWSTDSLDKCSVLTCTFDFCQLKQMLVTKDIIPKTKTVA